MSIHNYDHLLEFHSSKDFHIIRDVDDEGTPTFGIGFGQSVDEDGEITYEYKINLLAFDNENYEESDPDSTKLRLAGNIENVVRLSRKVKSLFGLEIIITLAIIILRHKEKTYALHSVLVGDEEKVEGWISFMNDVLAGVVLDGQRGDFSPITADMIGQDSDKEDAPNENEEPMEFSPEDLATVEYSNDTYVTANGIFRLPIPDGYHAASDEGDGNENWFYIIPDDVSSFEHHVDAKPFSFAVTTITVGQIPFDTQKIEGYKRALVQTGVLSSDVWVDTLILSSNCAFFYQCWSDTSDCLYHKINGLLFAGNDVYKFHIFANYDKPIAAEPGVLFEFMNTALSWMGRVSYIADSPYRSTDPAAGKSEVTSFIDNACGLVEKARSLLGITMDFDAELRKHFVVLGGLLYQQHNIELTNASVAHMAQMVGLVDGQRLNPGEVQKILDRRDAKYGDLHDYLESFSVTSVIKQMVKLDKIAKKDSDEGIAFLYYEAVDLFLRLLCVENNIAFAKSEFYLGCKAGICLTIGNVWESVNIHVFNGGAPVLSDSPDPEPPVRTAKTSTRRKAASQEPAPEGYEQLAKEDCEIDAIDTLIKYHGPHKRIILPDGIKRIEKNCSFYDIEGVVIPEGVTYIGESAFFCTDIEEVFLPRSLETIWNWAFRGCGKLKEIIIPEGVDWIGDDAFTNCDLLTDIYIPASVTYIGTNAFCTFNDDMVIHTPRGSEAQRYAQEHRIAFDHRPAPHREIPKVKKKAAKAPADSPSVKKTPQCIPNAENYKINEDGILEKYLGYDKNVVIPDGVTSIGESAFARCTVLVSITIPDSVTSIGKSAFWGCTSLENITFSDSVTSIEEWTFSDCTSLTSITIPDSVTSIGESAFNDCTSLSSITIPDSVTSIGKKAFWGCTSLENITFSDSVTSIEEWTFRDCTSLTSITIPDSVTSIESFAFCGCTGLKTIMIPGGIEIDDSAFYECTAGITVVLSEGAQSIPQLGDLGELMSEIKIPDSVTILNPGALGCCTNLRIVKIPDSVTFIDDDAFYNCTSLTSIIIPDSVVHIGNNAFSDCTSLVSITIPDSVQFVGQEAFCNCTSLTSITLPNSITTIAPFAFCDCTNLTSITIPDGVTSIGKNAFSGCTGLMSISLPDGVTSIENGAFSGCTDLMNIVIPNSVRSIGDWAFNESGLTSITIPKGVPSIGKSAFQNCTALTSVTIPDSVTSIGENAFNGCTLLTNVTIPEGVFSIGNKAFLKCGSLGEVLFSESVTSIGKDAFPKRVVWKVVKGSFAEQYCIEQKLRHTSLTREEMAALRSEVERKRQEEEERLRREAEEAERKRQEEEERRRREAEEAERKRQEEEERLRREAEEAERKRQEEEERLRREAEEAERKRQEEEERLRREAAEEAERKRQAELAAKRARYYEIRKNISNQEKIIAENRGWFGAQAKARKIAQEQLEALQAQLRHEFPKGKP